MYVSMKGMLQRANKGNYAVMAINCFNLESAKAVIEAAQELRAPIIIDLLQEHLDQHFDSYILAEPIIKMAQAASVEVAINLDHGQNMAGVKQCLYHGFRSVMVDASAYPIEENIAITKEMVGYAQTYDASVEAEVGGIGSVASHQTDEEMFTDPALAIRFAKETGIDALAISFGSSHGNYPAGFYPEFHFEILDEIKKSTNMPLVLHGGSGCGAENIRTSVAKGINKINVGADFMKAQRQAIASNLALDPEMDYVQLIHSTIAVGKQVVKEYIELAGSIGKSL
ncbi:class II fructose-bisphosphate aldolase [Vagococcus sp. BWB3-3]|uniref:Class II fructose-bisphosphate aldolase n=1 Tax=Vagococcus allomyrinae TaxID=2794353 RepID=A0A940SRN7_9ENTE|nr:class II fructose-bisphosphate aldolase [Vagococcus allomyrinae]MBP1041037.1 class II fructose-bisphosphate aldolase [Vagococcus allomyrinae]